MNNKLRQALDKAGKSPVDFGAKSIKLPFLPDFPAYVKPLSLDNSIFFEERVKELQHKHFSALGADSSSNTLAYNMALAIFLFLHTLVDFEYQALFTEDDIPFLLSLTSNDVRAISDDLITYHFPSAGNSNVGGDNESKAIVAPEDMADLEKN